MRKLLLSAFISTQFLLTTAAQKTAAIPVIFDTDMGPDYDDVGAIAMLHAYADQGKTKILATMASCKHKNVAATLSVFNTYFNRPELPIGVPKGNAPDLTDFQHWTDTVTANYPHKFSGNDEAPDAVKLYREILSKQKDATVTIISVGFFSNLAALLKSAADENSPLSGKELVKKKVKQLVSMAGKFPSGGEFNVNRDIDASVLVFENWPTTIILSGFEIGEKIKTGLPLINNVSIKNSPVKDVFSISIPLDIRDSAGRMSWDETAVLAGIAGIKPYYKLKQGKMTVSAKDGSNDWIDDPAGTHFHLVEAMQPKQVERIINGMMMHQPSRQKM